MTPEEACAIILGDELANSIILNEGVHWAVVSAMAAARTGDDPAAIAELRRWTEERRAP